MAGWRTATIRKDLRALAPTWVASVCGGVVAAIALTPSWVALAYAAGSVALGATIIGHEYSHRSLSYLLSQPVGRRDLLLTKAGALVAALAALFSAMFVFIAIFRPTAIDWTWLIVPVLAALCLAPWLSMIGRGPLAGMVFTVAALAAIWAGADLIATARFGLARDQSDAVAAFRVALAWPATLALCAVGAIATWRGFLRLEAVDSGPTIAWPGSRTVGLPAARRAGSRPTHWLRQLVRKEVQLQQMVFVIAGLYLLVWCMAFWSRRVLPGATAWPLAPLTALYGGVVCLLLGSFGSAEERHLGTLSSQTLLPVASWLQWLVKMVVTCSLALLLAVALPGALESLTSGLGGFDGYFMTWPAAAGLAVGATLVSLYISSHATSGLRALVMSIVAIACGTLLVGMVRPLAQVAASLTLRLLGGSAWYGNTHYRAVRAFVRDDWNMTILMSGVGALVTVLLMRAALRNHRSADLSARRVWRQAAWLVAGMMAFVVAGGALQGATTQPGSLTAADGGVCVHGRVEFDGASPRPTPKEWQDLWLELDRMSGEDSLYEVPGRFTTDGTFFTAYTWPGRYLVHAGAPTGREWTVERVTYRGHDVSEAPIEMSSDIDDVVITLTDHPGIVEGPAPGTDGRGAVVLLFPTDTSLWADYAVMHRRATTAYARQNGTFVFKTPVDGDYWLVAVSHQEYGDLTRAVDGSIRSRMPSPKELATLATVAERIQVHQGTTITRTLVVKQ